VSVGGREEVAEDAVDIIVAFASVVEEEGEGLGHAGG